MAIEQTALKALPERARVRFLTIRESYDLLLLVGLAVLLPGLLLLPVPLLRVPLGLIGVLLAPGYALTEAAFPRRDDLDGVARAALSFGLSIAALPVLALLLDLLPWGIRPWPMALSLSLWIVLFCGIALWRRWTLVSSGEAYALPTINPLDWWRARDGRSRVGYVVGALALAAMLSVGVNTLLTPALSTRLTEFYVLGADGMAENYPRQAAPGQEMEVQLGITNLEGAAAHYRVEIRSEDELLTQLGPIRLEAGGTWQGPLRYALAHPGDDQRMDILLFINDNPTPYRQLRLWVNVRESPFP